MAGDREIALFNLGDRFLAVASRCPHQGGPLADGIVAGASVVCPLHAWKIGLESGCVERPAGSTACVATYPTRVEAGVVMVELPVAMCHRLTAAPEPSRSAATGLVQPAP
jgi:nitrite reductase [NAD(P)H] small subunit